MKITRTLLVYCILLFPVIAIAQKIAVKPAWGEPVKLIRGTDYSVMAPSFTNAQYPELPESILPSLSKQVILPKGTISVTAQLDSVSYIPFTELELQSLSSTHIPDQPEVKVTLMLDRGNPIAIATVKPFGRNPETGLPAKLDYFGVTFITKETDSVPVVRQYAKHSRMVYGDWYKLFVRETGIYKITFDDMRNMGMQVDGIDPDYINMFGRGGAMMNESAGMSKYDDMTEISIKVVNAVPGKFAQGDYILFYGEGPVTWKHNPLSNRVVHNNHPYTDAIGYFITVAPYRGKRIPQADVIMLPANQSSNSYTALALYEKDEINIYKTGRKWFSNKFDNYTRTLNLPAFNFPDIDLSAPVNLGYGVAGKSLNQKLSLDIIVNNEIVNTTSISPYTGDQEFARELDSNQSFNTSSGNFNIKVQFNPLNSGAVGWLDYISLNVKSRLKFHGPQMTFRDPSTVGEGNITDFTLESTTDNLELWDVSDNAYVHRIPMSRSGNSYTFTIHTPYMREMMVFDGSSYLKPEIFGKVDNQDLHAIGNYDMIIVTHPLFESHADKLAELHNKMGEIKVKVVSLPLIYNEFSSGHQDITAIRDFMKMLYDRGRDQGYPRYLLLFGDASYDVRDRITGNTNFIPTYESQNSVKPVSSFLTDDYYGLLDNNEGGGAEVSGLVDVATGRLPVSTYEQATDVLHKIETYLTNDSLTHGDWRNSLVVIGDDEDQNTHFRQAETLADSIDLDHPLYNVNKVYFDAFPQNSTPGGGRYPDVNREIVSHVDKGALITNYIGHGGEVGWADERVLEIADILAWKNFNRMGLFFTATCEFSRFDNPQHTSAGELVFLNPEGGALAMITTTRLAYASTNNLLNLSFIDTVLNKAGSIPRMGDIIKYTKNDNTVSANNRQITLFGDPALKMPLPKYNIVTTSIVDPVTLNAIDTLSANLKVTVNGEVQDLNNQTMNGFNGIVFVKVYDKATTVRTRGQDEGSFQANFTVQKNIIYQGKATVNNGIFSITFPVPLDIDYNIGNGKISYYATDGVDDAHGYFTDFIIGGSTKTNEADETGPAITLYINDTTFINGDLTSENPKLLVDLFDESGINTLGNGVGHDLIAILDQNSYNSVMLNDFYVADRDSYQSGWANYHFFNLDDGPHSVTVKAWDVFNNSSEATVDFMVKHDIRLNIDDVIAYPNPSKGEVSFRFKHNLFDAILNLEIEIYNSTGTLVRILNPGKVTASGYIIDEVKWDGLSNNGTVLRNGLYVCRVKVLDRNGNSSAHSVKIVMAK